MISETYSPLLSRHPRPSCSFATMSRNDLSGPICRTESEPSPWGLYKLEMHMHDDLNLARLRIEKHLRG